MSDRKLRRAHRALYGTRSRFEPLTEQNQNGDDRGRFEVESDFAAFSKRIREDLRDDGSDRGSVIPVLEGQPGGGALDGLLLDIVSRLQSKLSAQKAETAHLKTIGLCEGSYAVANLISSCLPAPGVSGPSSTFSAPSACFRSDALNTSV